MASRTIPRAAVPMGAVWDPARTVTENAQAAWMVAVARIMTQNEKALRMGLRKAFGMTELPGEVIYLSKYPRVPLVEIDAYLVGFTGGTLALFERCAKCGEELNAHRFVGLADFGEALSSIEADAEPYTCRDCKYDTALSNLGRKR